MTTRKRIPKALRPKVQQAILDTYNNHPKYGGARGAHKITQEEVNAIEAAIKRGENPFTEEYWKSVGL